MIAGGFVIASHQVRYFYVGTCFFIIGNGFLQAEHQHHGRRAVPENDTRRDAGFSLFYTGINLGALLGGSSWYGWASTTAGRWHSDGRAS